SGFSRKGIEPDSLIARRVPETSAVAAREPAAQRQIRRARPEDYKLKGNQINSSIHINKSFNCFDGLYLTCVAGYRF
ncbi:hypothetical protein, partial [Burkholderia pseudomallei]|uniref:hypothetical protein n=1 Tax=Burkholderia pseudomallei TaxID=28450 RepID=UPI003CFAA1D0